MQYLSCRAVAKIKWNHEWGSDLKFISALRTALVPILFLTLCDFRKAISLL